MRPATVDEILDVLEITVAEDVRGYWAKCESMGLTVYGGSRESALTALYENIRSALSSAKEQRRVSDQLNDE